MFAIAGNEFSGLSFGLIIPKMIFDKKYAIVGNSGSGKSTLAKRIQAQTGARILDLDNITWERGVRIQKRLTIEDSLAQLRAFIDEEPSSWIIEGCYGELIEQSLTYSPTFIFLDPGEKICLDHCRNRPWEPHKYSSKSEQDKMLEFLLSWVSEYYRREGPMSQQFHQRLFEDYKNSKFLNPKF